jgi:hypothetical protein
MSGRTVPLMRLFQMLAGPAIWFAHLMLLYGVESLACLSPADAAPLVPWSAAAATLLALAALAFLAASDAGWRIAPDNPAPRANFLKASGFFLVLLSGVGVFWSAAPVLLLPACAAATG